MKTGLKYKVIVYYCIIFYILMIYKWSNGLFLYQLQPAFFLTRPDLITWLFMQTGLHQWLLNNRESWFLFDAMFYSMPLLYFLSYKYAKKFSPAFAVIMLLVNWCYVQCHSLYSSVSIEGDIAWLLFPIVFIPLNTKSFLFLFEGLRYFFLYFFASAAVWKFVQGGIFSTSEMSGILLYQHTELLTSSPGYWYSNFFLWLIKHPQLSYLLYLSATLLESSFIIGFFTKRFDRILFVLFIVFLLTDQLIMRIPYYEIAPLAFTLLLLPKKDDDAILAENNYRTMQ